MAAYRRGPPSSKAALNTTLKPSAITNACSTSASASRRRPAPSARAMEDAMPPPMAPAEVICISITTGKTSAMEARASAPSLPTK